MGWIAVTKKVKGRAHRAPESSFLREQLMEIFVAFDEPVFDMKTGKQIKGKAYESTEEAIQELGPKVVERILKNGETVDVKVTATVNQWEEDKEA